MDILDTKNKKDLLASLLAEVAKARNELNCAQRDVDKATSRLSFNLVLINELINREKD